MSHYYPIIFYALLFFVFIRLLQSSFIGKVLHAIITILFIVATLYVGYIVFIV